MGDDATMNTAATGTTTTAPPLLDRALDYLRHAETSRAHRAEWSLAALAAAAIVQADAAQRTAAALERVAAVLEQATVSGANWDGTPVRWLRVDGGA